MTSRIRFTIRRLLALNFVVAVLLGWLLVLSAESLVHADVERKTMLSVAMFFALPALLTFALVQRGETGNGRERAIRAGLGLHFAMMTVLCALPTAFWTYYLFILRGPLWPGGEKHIYGTVVPSTALVALYGLGCFLVIRSRGKFSRASHDF
jgi:hypothetical protein